MMICLTASIPRIGITIQRIIQDFFKKNSNSAIVYIRDQTDGKAKQSSQTFTHWFETLSEIYIKCDSHAKNKADDFYSSIVIPISNPDKGKLIDSFYYTIQLWMEEWG